MVMNDAVPAVAVQVDSDVGDGATDLAFAWAGLHSGRTASLALERGGTVANGTAGRPRAWGINVCRAPEEGDGVDVLRAAYPGPALADEVPERLHAGQTDTLNKNCSHWEIIHRGARPASRHREAGLGDSPSHDHNLETDGDPAMVRASNACGNTVRHRNKAGTKVGEERPRHACQDTAHYAARCVPVPCRRGSGRVGRCSSTCTSDGNRDERRSRPPPPFPPPTTAPQRGRLEGVAQLHDEIGAPAASPATTMIDDEASNWRASVRAHGEGNHAQVRGPQPPFPPPATAPREGRIEGVVRQQGGARVLLGEPLAAAPADHQIATHGIPDVPARTATATSTIVRILIVR